MRSRPTTAPTGPRRSPRSPTTSTSCWRSTTTPPSTGSTTVRPTPSSRPSPPSGPGSGSPRAPARGPPESRWPSSSSTPPRPGGAPSTPLTWSRWSEPVRSSRRASSSNDPRNQKVTPTPRDTPDRQVLTNSWHPRLQRNVYGIISDRQSRSRSSTGDDFRRCRSGTAGPKRRPRRSRTPEAPCIRRCAPTGRLVSSDA